MKRLFPISAAVLALVVGAAGHAGLSSAVQDEEAKGREAQPVLVQQKPPEPVLPAAPDQKSALELAKAEAEDDAATALGESICRFLGEYVGPAQESVKPSNPAKAGASYCPGLAADPGQDRFEVMLAVLPDPVHSHLALRFDRNVDAIQNSLQDLGWTYDGAWMPWEDNAHEETGTFEQRMTSEETRNAFQYGPGVMLFRNEGEGTRPLVLLTVGDTPTAGVNARQFRRAMSVYKRLTGWDAYFAGAPGNADNYWTLSVLGPSYSGSASSMRLLLEEAAASAAGPAGTIADTFSCPRRPLRIAVSTGTMSDSERVDFLAPDYSACKNLVLESRSFAIDLSYEYTELLDYLERHHHLQPEDASVHIGVLSEEESQFGATSLNPGTTRKRQKSAHAGSAAAETPLQIAHVQLAERHLERLNDDLNQTPDEESREKNAAIFSELLQPRKYYFPREISSLRSAYEQSGIFGFGAASDSDKTQLHLSFGSDARADDSVHAFAGKQGAVAMEAQMAQLATALEQDRITVVLLSATDTLDDIFVTRYLAEHAPNVAVIVMDADEIFLRSGSTGMQNAYVVSPWSLLPRNPVWSAASRADAYPGVPQARLFPSASTEAVYNAVRVLLCDPALGGAAFGMDACGAHLPDATVGLREYRPPVGLASIKTSDLLTNPPLWLMSISRGGFWPVALIDVDQMADCLPESAWFNLPPMNTRSHTSFGNCQVGLGYDPGLEKQGLLGLPKVTAVGVHEHAPRSAKVLMLIVALLLVWHGAACLYCRLDRDFAWSYALAEKAHMKARLALQTGLALLALPVLDLLDPISLPDMSVRSTEFLVIDLMLQVLALLVAAIPVYLWLGDGAWQLSREAQRKRWQGMAWRMAVGVALACGLHWLVWLLILPSATAMPTERAFFLYRSGYVFSGSSPALPLLLLLAAIMVALTNRFQRLVFYRGRIPQLPDVGMEEGYPGQSAARPLRDLLAHTLDPLRLKVLGVLSVLLVCLLLVFRQAIPRTLGHGQFDLWLLLLSGLVLLLLLQDLAISVLAWIMLRGEVLGPLAHTPIRWGFTWIDGFSWEKIWAPGAMSRHHLFRYIMRLEEANRRSLKDDAVLDAFAELRSAYGHRPAEAGWADNVTDKLEQVHGALALSAKEKLKTLSDLYKQDIGPITGDRAKERGLAKELALAEMKGQDREDGLRRVAMEEFVALLYLGFIRMVLLQIRNRLMTAACLYVLLLWALTSYPLLNHHAILICLSLLLLVLAAVVIGVYAQMHRDEILSRTTETTSGELGSDFFAKVLGMVGLPLTTLIASQFPELSNLIFSWLEPGLASMK